MIVLGTITAWRRYLRWWEVVVHAAEAGQHLLATKGCTPHIPSFTVRHHFPLASRDLTTAYLLSTERIASCQIQQSHLRSPS